MSIFIGQTLSDGGGGGGTGEGLYNGRERCVVYREVLKDPAQVGKN